MMMVGMPGGKGGLGSGIRANPTQADIEAIYARRAAVKDAPWPDATNPVFKTTPEAYAETEKLVPQQSIRDRLPAPAPTPRSRV